MTLILFQMIIVATASPKSAPRIGKMHPIQSKPCVCSQLMSSSSRLIRRERKYLVAGRGAWSVRLLTYSVDCVENVVEGFSNLALRSARCLASVERRVAVETRRDGDFIGVMAEDGPCFSSVVGITCTSGLVFCNLFGMLNQMEAGAQMGEAQAESTTQYPDAGHKGQSR